MADTPATFGGPGWAGRTRSHREDVESGELWTRCGVQDEYSRLQSVLISAPSVRFAVAEDPEAWLMLSWPELGRLEEQCAAVQAFFESQGVAVHVHRPSTPPPPNYLFMRDLVFMTPEGAIIGRPASPVRAPEARFAQSALAESFWCSLFMVGLNECHTCVLNSKISKQLVHLFLWNIMIFDIVV